MKMTVNRFFLTWLIFLSIVFGLCNSTLADDAALRKLRGIRVSANVPDNSGPLSFQLRNTLELNLRKAGLKINSDAPVELLLKVILIDIDIPEQKKIIGKYGMVRLSLHEAATLVRHPGIRTWACTWEGTAVLHGPLDTFADQTRKWASDLADDFLNRWMKVNTTMEKPRD
jgi:hypothetical protein